MPADVDDRQKLKEYAAGNQSPRSTVSPALKGEVDQYSDTLSSNEIDTTHVHDKSAVPGREPPQDRRKEFAVRCVDVTADRDDGRRPLVFDGYGHATALEVRAYRRLF